MSAPRAYLDWNASAPLRPEAREAMRAAMDAVGNPSAVHAEGRAARAIVERARVQVAALVACDPEEVIFTSGATEAAALRLSQVPDLVGADVEHDAVHPHLGRLPGAPRLPVRPDGTVAPPAAAPGPLVLQAANSETGAIQPLSPDRPVWFCDATQAVGKIPFAFDARITDSAILSAHKFGGPKGVGALLLREGVHLVSPGGGQETGRRGGTENVIGIAGLGAAAEAARRDLDAGVGARVAEIGRILKDRLSDAAPDLIWIAEDAPRLPNTLMFAAPGWRGETQVMAMDLAGFAVSAGSACASGKVGASRTLRAMGIDDDTAGCAIRVSLGPSNTEAEALAFVAAWTAARARRRAEAA